MQCGRRWLWGNGKRPTRSTLRELSLAGGPGDVRLVERHLELFHGARAGAEVAATNALRHALEDHAGQELGGRVLAVEGRVIVEVPEVELAEDRLERVRRPADVDHHTLGPELRPSELQVDHVRGTVQTLGRPEELAAKAVSNHHVSSNADAEHG